MSSENSSDSRPVYDAANISQYFDEYGMREWKRLVSTPIDEVSLYLHTHYLKQHIRAGMRVLEIGAGAGRFTQVLAGLGARILVGDISPGQLALNRQQARQLGFAPAVEDWAQMDISDLSRFAGEEFDSVVAFGGPFSYALDCRDVALGECLRVLKPGGILLLSVVGLWGTAHANLHSVLVLPPATNQRITDSGDLSPRTWPERKTHFMHMFRAVELRGWLENAGLEILAMSTAGSLCLCWQELLPRIRTDPEQWAELLRMELEACASPGCLDMGTHLIAVAKKP